MRSSVPCRTSPRVGAMFSPLDKQQEHKHLPVECQQEPLFRTVKSASVARGRASSPFAHRWTPSSSEDKLTAKRTGPRMAGQIVHLLRDKGERHVSILAVCFASSRFLSLLHGSFIRLCSIRLYARSYQWRPFTLALRWQRRTVTRQPAHRLYRDHARSARPPLRPTLDHGCRPAEIRPRGRRKRFRRRSTVVAGWQIVRFSGAPRW